MFPMANRILPPTLRERPNAQRIPKIVSRLNGISQNDDHVRDTQVWLSRMQFPGYAPVVPRERLLSPY